MLGNISVDPP